MADRKKASTAEKGQKSADEKAPKSTAKNVTPEEERFIAAHQDQLSRTTLRAKWTHSAEEHEDRAGQSLATRSHEVIQHWAEERQAVPATVPTTKGDGRPRVLRFDFPGYGGKNLEHISWDDWFGTFDERQLVFLYQEHKRDGQQSNFFRFDSPEREHE